MNGLTPDVQEQLGIKIRNDLANVHLFIGGAIGTCLVTVAAVATVTIVRPDQPGIVATIIGLTTPVTMALLAAGLGGIHKGVDGRLSQLLHRTAEASRATGREDAIRQMYTRLGTLEPGSKDHTALAEQIRAEAMAYFEGGKVLG